MSFEGDNLNHELDVESLLYLILKELEKLNFRLKIITDDDLIEDGDDEYND